MSLQKVSVLSLVHSQDVLLIVGPLSPTTSACFSCHNTALFCVTRIDRAACVCVRDGGGVLCCAVPQEGRQLRHHGQTRSHYNTTRDRPSAVSAVIVSHPSPLSASRAQETPIWVCTKKDRVVDVLKAGKHTTSMPSCAVAPSLTRTTAKLNSCVTAIVSLVLVCQGLISRNILSVPVLMENGKWYGFLDMMVSRRHTSIQQDHPARSSI